jgi:O-antigen/teichoic acid export membrane protein
MFKTESVLSVLDRVLMIIICGVLLWGHLTDEPFKIAWFVYSQTTAYLITALIAFWIVVKKAEFERLNWNWPFFVMIIKQSFPFAVLVLLMTFYNRIDSVMIERLLPDGIGDEQAGIYASAYRLLDASNMIAYLFSVLLLPLFSKMIKDGSPVVNVVKLAFTLLIIVSVIVSFGSCFYSNELMGMLYKEHVEQSADVFRLIMFGYIAISSTYVFGTLLTANGNLKHLNLVAGGGMLLNFMINLVLVPQLYAVGSAYASLIAQFATAILQVFLVIKIFNFKTDYRYIISIIIFVGGVLIINWVSKMVFENWIYNFILMLMSSLLLATGLKLLNIKGFINILTSKESF